MDGHRITVLFANGDTWDAIDTFETTVMRHDIHKTTRQKE